MATDPRDVKLAKVLTGHSIRIKKGDMIVVNAGVEAKALVLEVCKNILQKGAIPMVHTQMPGYAYTYYKYASPEMLQRFPELAMMEAKKAAGSIGIGTEYNTRELTNIDPKKIGMRRKVMRKVSNIHLAKNNWVICEYPTNSLAQDADMSLEEYENFVYSSCLLDWKKMEKQQDKLKKILDKGKEVRIVAKDTDLRFSIKGRTAIKCFGNRNMPDGEVFLAPVETSTEGYIHYTYPGIYSGREVEGIYLEFKKGKVVKATATKNEQFLKEMIKIDKGACMLGEFGIGTNFGIKQFSKQILFDEKIGGTIHLALGMAYKEGNGKNESALHWDMIKDLRKGGAFYVDGKCVEKNGKFVI